MVGALVGLLGGLGSGAMGLFAGVCCLFQFINLIGPALAGLVAGLGAGAMAPWDEFDGEGNLGKGVGLGARAGILAACSSAFLGFLATMLWPLASSAYFAMTSGGDVISAITGAAISLTMTALWALIFTGGGAMLGSLLGIAAGAVMGAIR